jgi:hypothetical protein
MRGGVWDACEGSPLLESGLFLGALKSSDGSDDVDARAASRFLMKTRGGAASIGVGQEKNKGMKHRNKQQRYPVLETPATTHTLRSSAAHCHWA